MAAHHPLLTFDSLVYTENTSGDMLFKLNSQEFYHLHVSPYLFYSFSGTVKRAQSIVTVMTNSKSFFLKTNGSYSTMSFQKRQLFVAFLEMATNEGTILRVILLCKPN